MNHSLLPIFISYIFNVYFIYCILRSSQTTRSLVRWLGCASQRTNGWSTTQSKFHLQHIYGFHFVLSVSLSWFWSMSVLPFFVCVLAFAKWQRTLPKKLCMDLIHCYAKASWKFQLLQWWSKYIWREHLGKN